MDKLKEIPVDDDTRTVIANVIWFDCFADTPHDDQIPEFLEYVNRPVIGEPDKNLVVMGLVYMGFPTRVAMSRISVNKKDRKELKEVAL